MDLRDLRAPAGGGSVVPRSREECDALPPSPHAEWWDGACVVSGSTNRRGRAVVSLSVLLHAACTPAGLQVGAGTGWRLPDAEFAPDVVVTRPAPDDELLTEAPVLIVEVLSRSTRHIYLGRKRELYAAGGLEWYWVVDLVRNEFTVFHNVGGRFSEAQRFGSGTTQGPVSIEINVSEL